MKIMLWKNRISNDNRYSAPCIVLVVGVENKDTMENFFRFSLLFEQGAALRVPNQREVITKCFL